MSTQTSDYLGCPQNPFNTDGSPREIHHKTSYQYPVASLCDAEIKIVIHPPMHHDIRINPRLRKSRSIKPPDTTMYTFSRAESTNTVAGDLCSESLDQAMTRVSLYGGFTMLNMLCYPGKNYSTDPDDVRIRISRETRHTHVTDRFSGDESAVYYDYALEYWTAASTRLGDQQWYWELECLRLRKTERAYWHVKSNLETQEFDDVHYRWLDVNVFGDSLNRPIVWWGHPDRLKAVDDELRPLQVQALGTDELDRRCPICLESYSTCAAPEASTDPSHQGESPVHLSCRCNRACGDKCLRQWLLQEGPSRCPSCRDDIEIPTFYSPYTGGWYSRQPKAHHLEFHSIQLEKPVADLSIRREVFVRHQDIDKLEVILPPSDDSMGPCWSNNEGESHRYRLTDPAFPYSIKRDPKVPEILRDALKDIMGYLADRNLPITQRRLWDVILDSADKSLRKGLNVPEGMRWSGPVQVNDDITYKFSYLEPAVAWWVTRRCLWATCLVIDEHYLRRRNVASVLDLDDGFDEAERDSMDEDRLDSEVEEEQEDGEWDYEDTGDAATPPTPFNQPVSMMETSEEEDNLAMSETTNRDLFTRQAVADRPVSPSLASSDGEVDLLTLRNTDRHDLIASNNDQSRNSNSSAVDQEAARHAVQEQVLQGYLRTFQQRFGVRILNSRGRLMPQELLAGIEDLFNRHMYEGHSVPELLQDIVVAQAYNHLCSLYPGLLPTRESFLALGGDGLDS